MSFYSPNTVRLVVRGGKIGWKHYAYFPLSVNLPCTITDRQLSGWVGDSGWGWGWGTLFGLQPPHIWFSHTDTTACPACRVYCLASPVPGAPGSWALEPRPCLEHILPGLRTSQQGLIPRKDSAALVLHRARQASTKMQTCVGSEAMEQGLENMASFLGIGTETQYSSAQLGWWPHYPVPSSSAVSFRSPPCPKTQAPRAHALLSTSSPWPFPREYLNSLILAGLSLAGEGRHPTPQPRRNFSTESVKSQTLKLHFSLPSHLEGSLCGAGCDHTLSALSERALNCLLLFLFLLLILPPLHVVKVTSPAAFPAYGLPLAPSFTENLLRALVACLPGKGKHCHTPHGCAGLREQQENWTIKEHFM